MAALAPWCLNVFRPKCVRRFVWMLSLIAGGGYSSVLVEGMQFSAAGRTASIVLRSFEFSL